MFDYEKHNEPILSSREFALRLTKNIFVAALFIGGALLVGILGYHFACGLSWIDALYNSSMILTGMGPVTILTTTGAKVFASFYALFSGVVFLTTIAVVLAPIIHRFLHFFHLPGDDDKN